MGSLIERKKRIMMATDPDLPPWYQRVEYIKATSSAFIATNYVPTHYDAFEIEYMLDANSGNKCLFSAGAGTYQLIMLSYVDGSASKYAFYYRFFSSGNAVNFHLNAAPGTWYKMTISADGVASSNGESITKAYEHELDGDNTTLYIFRRRNSSSQFVGKLKSFKIINNGTLKLNLIPCIQLSNGHAGVYDTVSKTFYGSGSPNEDFTPSTLDT